MRNHGGGDLAPAAAPLANTVLDPPHVAFLGLRFSLLSQQEAVRLIIEHCGAPYRYVVTPNAYDVVMVHEIAGLLPVYRDAWLSLCDSRIVRALAWLDGQVLPLSTGSDLVAELLATLNARGPASVPPRLLIVGPPRSAETALRAAFPNAVLDVMPAPPDLARDAKARLAVASACCDRSWDLLLLCVGGPTQQVVARQIGELGRTAGIALCVGAAIDFLTGTRIRAPLWLRRLSLEWAYRLVREPGRLWRRYLVESPKVFRIFLAHRAGRVRPAKDH
jgi:N-acetylglucosaminyldiphosphoundecaprenol N-acetyl-beta-D-mannosaminyltransferase